LLSAGPSECHDKILSCDRVGLLIPVLVRIAPLPKQGTRFGSNDSTSAPFQAAMTVSDIPRPTRGISVALFDFDGTLIRADSTLSLLAFLLGRYPRALGDLLRLGAATPACLAGLMSRDRLKLLAVRALRSVHPSDRATFFRDFHEFRLAPRYSTGAVERVRWHRSQGHVLVLVSASIDLYLLHAVRHLGFDFLVCTRAALDPQPHLVTANCRGREKVRRLSELDLFGKADWPASWAYSDSLSDLPLFQLCGHPVAANPNRALLRHARRAGWPILDW